MTGPANGHGAAPAAPMIQPQPTPFQAIVTSGTDPAGRRVVMLTLVLVTGTTVVFLPPDGAETMAADLTRIARTARSGLVLP